jgi:CHAT domain-containing protein
MASIVTCLLLALCALSVTGDRSPVAWEAVYRQARSQYDNSDFDGARRLAQRGYDYWRASVESRWHWQFRFLLAESLLELDKLKNADALLRDRPADLEFEARRLADRAFLLYRLRDFSTAEQCLDTAESLGGTSVPANLAAKIELIVGMARLKQEQYEQAERRFRRAAAFTDGAPSPLHCYALNNIGLTYLSRFRYDQALSWFERAQHSAAAIGARRAEMLATGNLGATYMRLGDTDRARGAFNRAVSLAQMIHSRPEEQTWLTYIGETYEATGDNGRAVQYYEKAWSLAAPGVDDDWLAEILEGLTNVALATGNVQRAEQLNTEASSLARKLDTKAALGVQQFNTARIAFARKRYNAAESEFRSAIFTSQQAQRPTLEWECHSGLAALYRATNRPAEADSEYRSAIRIIEEERSKIGGAEHRITFLSSLIRFYQDYVDFLMDRGEQARAFDVAASARARVLAERIGRPEVADAAVVARLQREASSTRTVLMSYWLAPRRSFLWVIGSSGLRAFTLPGQDAIAANVTRWRNAILDGKDPRETEQRAGEWLFENLVARHYRPPAGSRVVISPDGALYSLNFETLPAGARGEYWVRNVDITVAPSLALLRPEPEPAPGRLLLIADPDFSSPEFPRLPNAKHEVDLVSKHFAARDVYQAANATARAYLDAPVNSYSTIHFAAHAVASRDNPLDSAIILSGPRQDHKLYARDIMAHRLNAVLVTLSACQTAGAKTYSGEGLTGLAWAFLSAGARNVVAGLWDVDDRATAEMMSRFYDSISRGRTPSESLREAKIALLDSPGPMRKPVYWAAFETFTRALYVNGAGAPAGMT